MHFKNRRTLIAASAAGIVAPYVWTGARAFGAQQITVADVGGAPGDAIRKAFYEPFEKETGIKVIGVAHDSDPTTQFKLAVDTRSFIWDVCSVTPGQLVYLSRPKSYVENLNMRPDDFPDLLPGMITPTWVGFSVWSNNLAYRTDKFPNGAGPQTWADYWNVKKFPGRRGLYKNGNGTLEAALMADGVPASKLYPLDVDRAFRMLDKIKPYVNVWWTTGAQNTQILQSGEVAMSDTWGSRAYAAIESGSPIRLVWSEGLYSMDGWSIPAGCPRADLGRKFIRFCMKPELQAIFSNQIVNAPTNRKAYQFISPDRARMLATSPENIRGMAPSDQLWWADNRDKVLERLQDWLLS
ncbi:ABC transporter substrate-binding protein [Paraburkholderia sp. J41]|uniref:ABC transporter substrate-binding protein n=1 Tax=Paraburkholderia sp. J41 TaxID=2805433 RepID=UPI002AC33D2F|nr:ABC transporter substrate-binding protein [Paraburkholderia sp. J41]